MARTARDYHERTKHRVTNDGDHRPLDWANKPLPRKLYPDVSPIPLPLTWPESAASAAAVLCGELASGSGQLDLPDLARLLFLCAGVTRLREAGPNTTFLRAAPSAGALYPVELYAVTGELPNLPAGLYHFEPVEFALRRLRSGDMRWPLAEAAAEPERADCLVTFVFTGIPWRTTWKYGARGYRHLYWDAGTMLANLVTAAASVGLRARVLAGFVDADVAHLLGLDNPRQPFSELPLAIAQLHAPGPQPPLAVEPPRLELGVAPLSPAQVDEPELRAAHEAGRLDSKDLVVCWRKSVAKRSSPSAWQSMAPPDDAAGTVDEVVLRRGSTRRFARNNVSRASLEWGLAVASSPVVADFVGERGTLLNQLLTVHAVEGLPPGAYRWTSGGPVLLRRGVFRAATAHLCLDQALGGDAAFTVFACAELEALLDSAGARAYRAAQLEAGIAAERLQLAAFALGLGGSGLTFYDDEVRQFFGTKAEPMLAVAIGVPAYESNPGRRPSQLPPWRPESWGWSEQWT